jgi:hypothetical protein
MRNRVLLRRRYRRAGRRGYGACWADDESLRTMRHPERMSSRAYEGPGMDRRVRRTAPRRVRVDERLDIRTGHNGHAFAKVLGWDQPR